MPPSTGKNSCKLSSALPNNWQGASLLTYLFTPYKSADRRTVLFGGNALQQRLIRLCPTRQGTQTEKRLILGYDYRSCCILLNTAPLIEARPMRLNITWLGDHAVIALDGHTGLMQCLECILTHWACHISLLARRHLCA